MSNMPEIKIAKEILANLTDAERDIIAACINPKTGTLLSSRPKCDSAAYVWRNAVYAVSPHKRHQAFINCRGYTIDVGTIPVRFWPTYKGIITPERFAKYNYFLSLSPLVDIIVEAVPEEQRNGKGYSDSLFRGEARGMDNWGEIWDKV